MYDYPYEYYNRKRAKRKAFFAKAIVLFSVFALSAVVIVCVTAFSSEKAGFPDCVYLLAAETSDAEEVSSKGGAGVVYESGGERYPLYACYYVRAEAESVAARLRDAGESVSVLERGGGALCFGGAAEKEAKNAVCAIVSAALECSRALYSVANGLEKGEISQAGAAAAVKENAELVSSAFSRADAFKIVKKEKYRGFFSFGENFAAQTDDALSGGLSAGEARGLQARLCVFYILSFKIFGK